MIIVIIAIEIIILVLMAIVKMTIVIIAIVIIIIVMMMISHCKVKNTYHDRQSGCKDFLLFLLLNVDFGTVQTEWGPASQGTNESSHQNSDLVVRW